MKVILVRDVDGSLTMFEKRTECSVLMGEINRKNFPQIQPGEQRTYQLEAGELNSAAHFEGGKNAESLRVSALALKEMQSVQDLLWNLTTLKDEYRNGTPEQKKLLPDLQRDIYAYGIVELEIKALMKKIVNKVECRLTDEAPVREVQKKFLTVEAINEKSKQG